MCCASRCHWYHRKLVSKCRRWVRKAVRCVSIGLWVWRGSYFLCCHWRFKSVDGAVIVCGAFVGALRKSSSVGVLRESVWRPASRQSHEIVEAIFRNTPEAIFREEWSGVFRGGESRSVREVLGRAAESWRECRCGRGRSLCVGSTARCSPEFCCSTGYYCDSRVHGVSWRLRFAGSR